MEENIDNKNNNDAESKGKKVAKKGLVITLKGLIVLIVLFIILISLALIAASFLPQGRPTGPSNHEEHKKYSITLDIKPHYRPNEIEKKEVEEVLIDSDFSVDLEGKKRHSSYDNLYGIYVTSYKDYQKATERYTYPKDQNDKYNKEFFKNNNLAIFMSEARWVGDGTDGYYYMGEKKDGKEESIYFSGHVRLEDIYFVNFETEEEMGDKQYKKAYFIPVDKDVKFVKFEITQSQVDGINTDMSGAFKPIIYLYPEEEMNVEVKLLNKDLITCSYPKYEDGWSVQANPNGDLIDKQTGRNLYALYYESDLVKNAELEDEGFSIKGEDTAKFLEEKLALLGLTDREAEEFIVYWLPKLEANKYNYIRFLSKEEIEGNMPLEITPNPDSVIRVWMSYKGLDKPVDVEEQILETPERTGFTVVEWGGTEIKD